MGDGGQENLSKQQGNHMGKRLLADRIQHTSQGLWLGGGITKLGTPQKLSQRNGRLFLGNVRSHCSSSFLQKQQGGGKERKE